MNMHINFVKYIVLANYTKYMIKFLYKDNNNNKIMSLKFRVSKKLLKIAYLIKI